MRAGIVCCSNGQSQKQEKIITALEQVLLKAGIVPVFSPFIYERRPAFSAEGKARAECVNEFYADHRISAVFDISGGDIANEILPFLDYEMIAGSDKSFWGYSDLTTVINAIYAKTGKVSVLYQIKNLVYQDSGRQQADFFGTVLGGKEDLFRFGFRFIQKKSMKGIVVGGNIRCLLKLAGTPYWPDMREKILLLESRSGMVPQMVTYLNQLKQIGVFEQIRGIILGTFTEMEREECTPAMTELVRHYAGETLPIVKTDEIGHGVDSKAILIGREITLSC